MKCSNLLMAVVAAAGAATIAGHAGATNITGGLYFGGSNGYDPAGGNVPAGYENVSSNTVAVGPGVEFGFNDGYNLDTADFSATSLTLGDSLEGFGALPWQQTFTADTPGYFNGLTLASDTFSGLTYSVAGDTLTVNWLGTYAQDEPFTGDYTATFTLVPTGGVPEPASWAFMIAGIGGVGMMLRRVRRAPATTLSV